MIGTGARPRRWGGMRPTLALALLAPAVALVPVVFATPAKAQQTCQGQTVTITVPNPDDDNDVDGTVLPDVVALGPGNDTFHGRQGDDVVCGGEGNDQLFGSSGTDALDEEASSIVRFAGGRIMMIREHAFRADVVGENEIFKIPNLRVSRTYVSQRFVDRWTESGLKGLDFNQVWAPPRSRHQA